MKPKKRKQEAEEAATKKECEWPAEKVSKSGKNREKPPPPQKKVLIL